MDDGDSAMNGMKAAYEAKLEARLDELQADFGKLEAKLARVARMRA